MAAPSTPLFNWLDHRAGGVLLHPTALPGPLGCGTLGEPARRFLDVLAAAGLRYWQLLPLGPTGFGDSPYSSISAFAGNPFLLDLHALVSRGWLPAHAVDPLLALPHHRVDFNALVHLHPALLARAHAGWTAQGRPADPSWGHFDDFLELHGGWLEPYCAFRALKDAHGGVHFREWPREYRRWSKSSAAAIRSSLGGTIEVHAFAQWVFFGQWAELRAAAHQRGIDLIGDLPLYVSDDSADLWSNPGLFQLEGRDQRLTAVAGCPPDYFSADGQHWGNPLYDWNAMARDNFAWWIARLRHGFSLCDVLRIDHFRGLDTYWSIPASAATAREGHWENGPGLPFFSAIKSALPTSRLIAEDLGDLSPSVHTLRAATGLPGMAILQFAWGSDARNLYLPHNLQRNTVVYPGTHDNDTSLGWYRSTDDASRHYLRSYLRVSGDDVAWDLIRTAWSSVANLAIVPLQDLLSLGSEARFNTPGTAQGNWNWRCTSDQLNHLHGTTAPALLALSRLCARDPAPPQP